MWAGNSELSERLAQHRQVVVLIDIGQGSDVPEELDDDLGFEEALRDIHVGLEVLNAEVMKRAATIKRNFSSSHAPRGNERVC